ncbi:MAG: DUF134 domain-containing protein [Planctomycetota bacterium]|jgi:predicted DNA-binding protein (UPF0251 family)
MPRPFKCRQVNCEPEVSYFKPRGIPLTELDEVVLTVDEFESIRLADIEGMYQEEAAKEMDVSRQTFGNIVKSAHRKIADALVKGKAIKIKGGVYNMAGMRKFKCYECNHVWEIAFGSGRPGECPKCQSNNIHRAEEERGHARTGGFRRARRRCGRI